MIIKIECDDVDIVEVTRIALESIEQSQIFFSRLKCQDIVFNNNRYLMTVSKAGNVFVKKA